MMPATTTPATAAFDPILALQERLRAAAELLDLPPLTTSDGGGARGASAALDRLAQRVHRGGDVRELWLSLAVASGSLPAEHEVLAVRRALELDDPRTASRMLMDVLASSGGEHEMTGALGVRGGVLMDAGHTALSDLHTGIQRVVREVLRRWTGEHPVEVVAWSSGYRALRTLRPREHQRVSEWTGPLGEETGLDERDLRVVLPWKSTVVLPELPPEGDRIDRLRSLARFSGNRLVVIGYDAIPLTSAEAVTHAAADVFANYLSAVKHADRVVTISRSAASEFEGFAAMLGAQGLRGPDVRVCTLPTDVPPADGESPEDDHEPPMVLCVGTLEPRKNQQVVLHAAEKLWRRGFRFRLVLLGGAGILGGDIVQQARALQTAGRPVELRHGVGDAELWSTFRRARFTVFVSAHEGYGLPVAESLACGTPVITTGHGSTGEVAEGGGCLLVDPRDEPALESAIARMLEDDRLVADLRAQAIARPVRTWDDYARDLWAALTTPATGGTRA